MQTLANGAQTMTKHPYGVPAHLTPGLTRVLAYWRGLLRGAAEMPFADDLNLSVLPDLSEDIFLIDVFQQPERFRFDLVGGALGKDLAGRFLDEAKLEGPFEFLRSQCAAAIEGAAPTYLHLAAKDAPGRGRLLLPMWGEGAISRLLGAVEAD